MSADSVVRAAAGLTTLVAGGRRDARGLRRAGAPAGRQARADDRDRHLADRHRPCLRHRRRRAATATLKTAVGGALPGIPFAFWQASWSDPLGFAPGALRGRPATAPAGSTLLLRQTIAATSALAKIISVTTTWTGVS